jgi:membrane associated rhomboid family serine protease
MRLPPARATSAIVIATGVVWLILFALRWGDTAAFAGGFIPVRIGALFSGIALDGPIWMVPAILTPLSATLLHAGLVHLAFNMLMFGYCGRFVEAAMGTRGLVVLYLIGAYAAALAHYAANTASHIPMIGASGAVSAVFGAYAMIFGERRRTVSDPRLNRLVNVAWLAAAWIGLQLLIGLASDIGGGGIAIAAHIGGFLAGLALARPLLAWRYLRA